MNGVLVSTRLRELRQSYNGDGISFEKLAEALRQKYNCNISMQVLKNYERAAITNGSNYVINGNAISGMRIEYLFMFADFYRVSADWILGITEQKTRNASLQAASAFTGLSEENTSFLNRIKGTFITRIIDFLLDDARLDDGDDRTLIKLLRFFLDYDGGKHPTRRININGDIRETPTHKHGISTDTVMLDERIIENAILDEIKNRLRKVKGGYRNGKH